MVLTPLELVFNNLTPLFFYILLMSPLAKFWSYIFKRLNKILSTSMHSYKNLAEEKNFTLVFKLIWYQWSIRSVLC
jgi:CBS domain containing-hemolysin-like protein